MRIDEFSWAVGFWEGEGGVGYHRCSPRKDGSRLTSLILSASQTDPEVLNRLRDAFGVGAVYGPYPNTNGNDIYKWQITGVAAFELAKVLSPLVSTRRRLQLGEHMETCVQSQRQKPVANSHNVVAFAHG